MHDKFILVVLEQLINLITLLAYSVGNEFVYMSGKELSAAVNKYRNKFTP